MSMLDEALRYSKMNLSVIPVGKDKRPLFSWKEYQDRLATEDEIKTWWTKYPEANIGIVTGKISVSRSLIAIARKRSILSGKRIRE
jgi:putative DNA primase/helicase